MASERRRLSFGAAGLAFGIAVRAALAAAFALAAGYAAFRQLYATAVVLGGIAALIALDIARLATVADRQLARFVDSLTAEGDERPAAPSGLDRLSGAISRALEGLARTRALRQQRIDYLEALSDSIAAALIVLTPDGKAERANRTARRLLGEIPGPLEAHPVLGAAAGAQILALPSGGRAIVRLADGQAMLASSGVFRTPGAAPRRLIALQSLAGDLDAVEVKAWHDLSRVLAHEMMNSLTPILSLSESIATRLEGDDTAAAADVREAALVVARRSAGLMSFVERYRQVADLPEPKPAVVPVGQVLDGLEALTAPMLRAVGVAFRRQPSPAGLTVRADADLVEQALINLLKNAQDAVAGRTGAEIRLSAALEDGKVVFQVADNGPGLATPDPESAFVPFFTTKAGGSGIGLTLARQIALAHGGRLDHTPRPGGGACFRLSLPAGG